MAAANRDYCIDFIIDLEGGAKIVNDPHDPGLTTRYGISQKAYPNLDIMSLDRDDAELIYRRDYWDKISGDYLKSGNDLMVFDCAVNQGVSTAIKLLQLASKAMPDGVIGPRTLAAQASSNEVLWRLGSVRALRYHNTDGANFYMAGWMNRLFRVFETAIGMQ
jgi:lysozyme family protein